MEAAVDEPIAAHHEERREAEQETMSCVICGEEDSVRKRLCCFHPSELNPERIVVHVFCGKTAAILPHVNRPELEILTKSGIKNKHGTGPCVLVALQRSRTAIVAADGNNREQEYYLVREFEEHLGQVAHQRTVLNPHDAFFGTDYPDAHTSSGISPPTKKLKESKTPTKNLKESKTPYEVAMERLQRVTDACGGVGYSLVRGVSHAMTEDDYAEEDEENFDPKRCSQAQVNHVRVIIVTENRQKQMEHMVRLILEEFSNQVMEAWRVFQCKYRNQKSWPNKFDMLVGFTDALKDHNTWMHEAGFDQMVAGLARLWKTLLRKSDQELDIDGEFTRPGVLALLDQFQSEVESVEVDPPMRFRYRNV